MQRIAGRTQSWRERKDSGAVAVIFALSLVMLLGFVGLGVDVAGAYAKTQEVQNAADAAALGMAQECAQEGDLCAAVSPLAVDLAGRNIRQGFSPDPGNALSDLSVPQRVTVEVLAESDTFFVQLFGIDSFDIARQATAAWDSPVKLTTMLPLTVGECEFDYHGGISGDLIVVNLTKSSDSDCDRPPSENDAPGSFGYIGGLDTGCEVPVDINNPWVEGNKGNDQPTYCPWQDLKAVVDSGGTVLVPIFDACRVKNNNNNAPMCSVNTEAGAPDAEFHVKGFAAFELHGFKFSGGGDYVQPKPPACNRGNDRCIWGRFVEWVTLEDVDKWGEVPEDYGVQSVRLINP